MEAASCILFSGGAGGAEATFGINAERVGVEEVNFTFEGHQIERSRGVRVHNREELAQGDVSLTYVSHLMNRTYTQSRVLRQILQTIWYQVNSSMEVYVIGQIQADNTVRGGTGWGAEFAKLCNKVLYIFDQDRDGWFAWNKAEWVEHAEPKIQHVHFAGTGTRLLQDNGTRAIADLFTRSFS